MFHVVHYMPIHRNCQYENKVNAAVTNFETEDEELVREIFEASYIGQNIIYIAPYSSTQLADKHIADNSSYIARRETFFLPMWLKASFQDEPSLPYFQ